MRRLALKHVVSDELFICDRRLSQRMAGNFAACFQPPNSIAERLKRRWEGSPHKTPAKFFSEAVR